MKRREFLGAVTATAAVSAACHEISLQRIVGDVPVRPAPSLRPGVETRVDTICGACPSGCGIRVRVVDGNAVQVEGLRDHPINNGGICPRGAAEIQNLYHPARLTGPLGRVKGGPEMRGAISWDTALEAAAVEWRAAREAKTGAPAMDGAVPRHASRPRWEAEEGGVLFVLGPTVSPAEVELVSRMAQGWPSSSLVRIAMPMYEFPNDAFRLMLGMENARYDFQRTEYVLSIQSDWLQASPSPVEIQRAYAELRRSRQDRRVRMSHAGSRLSVTALKSDRWIPIRSGSGAAFAHSVAAALIEKGLYDRRAESLRGFGSYREGVLSRFGGEHLGIECGAEPELIRELAEEFGSRRPAIAVGCRGSLAEQCAVTALNLLAGSVGVPGGILNVGRVPFRTAVDPAVPSAESYLAELAEGKRRPPKVVILYKANPLYGLADSPEWTRFFETPEIRKISLSSFEDESAQVSDLVLPLATPLESRAFRWGASFLTREPVLSTGPAAVPPLDATREGMDILFDLAARSGIKLPWENADGFQNQLLAEVGADVLAKKPGTWAFPAETPRSTGPARFVPPHPSPSPAPEAEGKLQLEVYPLLAFPYGEGAHLPYLHGLTAPSTRETWSSWVDLHPETAEGRGIRDGDRVEVASAGGRLTAVARVTRGIHPGTAAMPLGLGRRTLGTFAEGHGADPAALLIPSLDAETHRHTWEGTSVEVRKIG